MPRRPSDSEGREEAGEEAYSLWTAPPGERHSPTEAADIENLECKLTALESIEAADDARTRAFTTPVTPEVLSQPTES